MVSQPGMPQTAKGQDRGQASLSLGAFQAPMRRAHSVRNHVSGRSSLQIGTDDMGTLTECDERSEDGLRKKLLEKDRENDKVRVFRDRALVLNCD